MTDFRDFPYHVTIKATDPKGEVTYTTKGGETADDARIKAIRWGVAYYLYDNKHVIGQNAALTSSSLATRMIADGDDRLEYDGFTFEVMPVDLLTGV